MSEEKDKIEKLEQELLQTQKDAAQQLVDIRSALSALNIRFESVLRGLVRDGKYNFDKLFTDVDEYRTTIRKVSDIITNHSTIKARLDQALEYNKEAYFPIYADDLDILSKIEDAGGTSPTLAEELLNLPHTTKFKEKLSEYLPNPKKDKDKKGKK